MISTVTREGVPASDAPAAESPAGHDVPVIVIDGSTHWTRWWLDLYLYRGALLSLMWRNVRSRYKQAALGMSWALVQPLVQVGVFTVLLGMLAGVPSGEVPYPVFALAGLLPWNFFAKVLSEGAISLVANQHIVTKLFFPRIYLVFAVSASALIDLGVGLALLVVMAAFYGIAPGPEVLLAVPALFGAVLFSLGVAALFASLNARWRDVQHTVPFLVQIGLFVTPVLYRDSLIPEQWRWLIALNPLTGFIEVFRGAALGMPLPDAHVLLISLGVALMTMVGGVWLFTRAEATVVDVI